MEKLKSERKAIVSAGACGMEEEDDIDPIEPADIWTLSDDGTASMRKLVK